MFSLRLVSCLLATLTFYLLVYTFSCHQKTIKYAIAYMSRTQIEFITPKCSRLLYGMFRELFEQIINIFLPKELPQSDFIFSLFWCASLCYGKNKDNGISWKKALRCIRNFKKQTQAVQKRHSELNNRNTIKKNVATSSNRINKFLLVTVVVAAAERHKKCFFRLNKIIFFLFCYFVKGIC